MDRDQRQTNDENLEGSEMGLRDKPEKPLNGQVDRDIKHFQLDFWVIILSKSVL